MQLFHLYNNIAAFASDDEMLVIMTERKRPIMRSMPVPSKAHVPGKQSTDENLIIHGAAQEASAANYGI